MPYKVTSLRNYFPLICAFWTNFQCPNIHISQPSAESKLYVFFFVPLYRVATVPQWAVRTVQQIIQVRQPQQLGKVQYTSAGLPSDKLGE